MFQSFSNSLHPPCQRTYKSVWKQYIKSPICYKKYNVPVNKFINNSYKEFCQQESSHRDIQMPSFKEMEVICMFGEIKGHRNPECQFMVRNFIHKNK